MGFILAHNESRRLQKKTAMNKIFQRRTIWWNRTTTKENIDQPRNACNVQILQNLNTFRWSRMTLMNDPSTRWIKIKIHVFSDSTLFGSLKIQRHTKNWLLSLLRLSQLSPFLGQLFFYSNHSVFLWEFVWLCWKKKRPGFTLKAATVHKNASPMLERLLSVQHLQLKCLEKKFFLQETHAQQKPSTNWKHNSTWSLSYHCLFSRTFYSERETKLFLIRNLMKQILKTLNKSAIINDLIKNYDQNNAEKRFLPCIKSSSTKR